MAIKDIKNAKKFTKENAAEMGRKGGENSGRSRRFAKNMYEAFIVELKRKTTDGKANGYEAIAKTAIRESLKGNVRAMEFVAKIVGEITDHVEVTGKDGKDLVPAKTLTKEQARELMNELENEY